MTELGKDPFVRFVGYGLLNNKGANGTILNMDDKVAETTVSENLMVGLAVGMSLQGLRPLIYLERMDFLPLALCPIINQLDSIGRLSCGQYKPAAIIRIMVGSRSKPPFTALTHTRDLSAALRNMVSFTVIDFGDKNDSGAIQHHYEKAREDLVLGISTILVDHREFL